MLWLPKFLPWNFTKKFKMLVKSGFAQACLLNQGSHRLEKYFNLEGFLEKSLKIKSALKSTGKSPKALKSP